MAFAREIQDFISAFSAVRGALGSRSEREMEREAHRAKMDYMRAQTDYMGSLTAKNQPDTGLIDYARSQYSGGTGGTGGGSFEATVAEYAPRLAKDAGISIEAAVGVLGQLGHESEGLKPDINERNPVVAGSRGGVGWSQWTGPRRVAFEQFVGNNPMDNEANYQFLLHELKNTPEGKVLAKLRNVHDPLVAGRIFTDEFLRPGIPGYESRDAWTKRAASVLLGGAGNDTLEGNLPVAGENGVTEEDIDVLTMVDEDGNYVSAIPEEGGQAIDPAAKDDLYVPATADPVEVPNPKPRPELAGGAGNDRLEGSGGFDPLPQTSGHLDPVSRAGHDDLAQLTGGRNTPPREVVKNALNWGVKTFGLGNRQAIDDGSTDAAADAYISGHGAANVSQIEQIQQLIDPNGEMTESERVMRSLSTAYDYYLSRGEGDKAQAVAFSMLQSYRQMSQRYMAIAQAAVEGGDIEGAVEAAVRAYTIIPDGRDLSIVKNGDGYAFRYTDEETGRVVQEGIMSPQEIGGMIMRVSPADFDQFIIAAAGGDPSKSAPAGPSDAFKQGMRSLSGGAPAPMAIDPMAKDDMIPGAAPAPGYSARPQFDPALAAGMTNEEQDNYRASVEAAQKQYDFDNPVEEDSTVFTQAMTGLTGGEERPVYDAAAAAQMSPEQRDDYKVAWEAATKQYDDANPGLTDGLSVSDNQLVWDQLEPVYEENLGQLDLKALKMFGVTDAAGFDAKFGDAIRKTASVLSDPQFGNNMSARDAVDAAFTMMYVDPAAPLTPRWQWEEHPDDKTAARVSLVDENGAPTGQYFTMPITHLGILAEIHQRHADEATAFLGAQAKEEAFRAERDARVGAQWDRAIDDFTESLSGDPAGVQGGAPSPFTPTDQIIPGFDPRELEQLGPHTGGRF